MYVGKVCYHLRLKLREGEELPPLRALVGGVIPLLPPLLCKVNVSCTKMRITKMGITKFSCSVRNIQNFNQKNVDFKRYISFAILYYLQCRDL